jgi:hypothetical protein
MDTGGYMLHHLLLWLLFMGIVGFFMLLAFIAPGGSV